MLYSLLLQGDEGGGGFSPFWSFLSLVLIVLAIVAYWRIFTKAEQPGWAAIIPIYNIIVMLRVVGRPWWWLLLMLIPFVNLVVLIIVMYDLARSFGHGGLFTLGLIILPMIFALIIAFGSSRYLGPAGRGGAVAAAA